MVIGCPGSGKSTFARELAAATELPVVHIDRLYWQPGWVSVSAEELDARLASEVAKDRWIIDGNYSRTIPMRLARCDAVVWLDLPRRQCLYGAIKRVLLSYGKTREDMGEGCPERLDLEFLKYIWNFGRRQRGRIEAMLEQTPPGRLFRVRRRRELEAVRQEITKAFGE